MQKYASRGNHAGVGLCIEVDVSTTIVPYTPYGCMNYSNASVDKIDWHSPNGELAHGVYFDHPIFPFHQILVHAALHPFDPFGPLRLPQQRLVALTERTSTALHLSNH